MKRTKTSPAVDQLETVFKALADKTRLRILSLLGNNEVCVCHIHDSLGLPQPTVSRHLAYLRRTGLVDARRDGVWMHYRVARSLDPNVQTILNAAERCGSAAVARASNGYEPLRRLSAGEKISVQEKRSGQAERELAGIHSAVTEP